MALMIDVCEWVDAQTAMIWRSFYAFTHGHRYRAYGNYSNIDASHDVRTFSPTQSIIKPELPTMYKYLQQIAFVL